MGAQNLIIESPFYFYSATDKVLFNDFENLNSSFVLDEAALAEYKFKLHNMEETTAGTPDEFNPKSTPIDSEYNKSKLAIFKTIIYPHIGIEMVPYYEQEVAVSDFPPIPPNVNFDPLIGKGSKLLLTFENQTGDRQEIPVSLTDNDSVLFNIHRKVQGKDPGEPIRFKSDDFPQRYEVWRTTLPPSNYESFSGAFHRFLDTEQATGYIEDLEPNVTYYYMFRTVDVHNSVSNPSNIFSVQMVFDSGVYYPIVEEYNFEKPDNTYVRKQFKQYLKIEASQLQKLVNKEKSNITDASALSDTNPVLGVLNESLWNYKQFKFRIMSKHTGKAIDLNIKFKTNHTDNEKPIKTC